MALVDSYGNQIFDKGSLLAYCTFCEVACFVKKKLWCRINNFELTTVHLFPTLQICIDGIRCEVDSCNPDFLELGNLDISRFHYWVTYLFSHQHNKRGYDEHNGFRMGHGHRLVTKAFARSCACPYDHIMTLQ